MRDIVRLYGVQVSIMSDWDPRCAPNIYVFHNIGYSRWLHYWYPSTNRWLDGAFEPYLGRYIACLCVGFCRYLENLSCILWSSFITTSSKQLLRWHRLKHNRGNGVGPTFVGDEVGEWVLLGFKLVQTTNRPYNRSGRECAQIRVDS